VRENLKEAAVFLSFVLLIPAACLAQDEPTRPENMTTGQLYLECPEGWQLVVTVDDPPRRCEAQINLYSQGARVFEVNNHNRGKPRTYTAGPGRYMLRGWTKMRDPDNPDAEGRTAILLSGYFGSYKYHPWFPAPFKELERNPETGKLRAVFDDDARNPTFDLKRGCMTVVTAEYRPTNPSPAK
jgi:hypothetical protein